MGNKTLHVRVEKRSNGRHIGSTGLHHNDEYIDAPGTVGVGESARREIYRSRNARRIATDEHLKKTPNEWPPRTLGTGDTKNPK